MEPNAVTHEDSSKDLKDFLITERDRKTIAIPTLRFGRPATVTIYWDSGPPGVFIRVTGSSNKAPQKYIITDAKTKDSLVLGYTEILSPVPDFVETLIQPATPTTRDDETHAANMERSNEIYKAHIQSRKEANEIWHNLAPVASEAFYSGQPASTEIKEKLPEAIRHLVAESYLLWLQTCCADFFEWLKS